VFGRFHPFTDHEGLYSILDLCTRRGWEVSVTPRQHITPGKDPVPIVLEAGWASGPVWTGAENLAPPGFDPRTVQPVGSRYTDWATGPITILFSANKLLPLKYIHHVFFLKFLTKKSRCVLWAGKYSIWRHIQCVHALWGPIVFTQNHKSWKF